MKSTLYTRSSTLTSHGRFSVLFLLFSLILSHPVLAEELWVIGSFKDQTNAVTERERVRADTGLAAEINESDGYFRLVVPKSSASRSEVESHGYSPWTHEGDIAAISELSMTVKNQYRVLGSFVEASSAELLLEKIMDTGADDVAVIPVEVRGVVYHRLVQGPYTARSQATASYADLGLPEPWWWEVKESAPARDVEMASAAGTQKEQQKPEPPEPMKVEPEPEPEPVVVINPPGPNDNYVNYCLRANKAERAIFCENDLFKRVGTAKLRENDDAEEMLLKCVYATRDSANCN